MSTPGLPLAGRVAVVTGGTSGIGLALVRGLAEAGATSCRCRAAREQVDAAAAEVEVLRPPHACASPRTSAIARRSKRR